MTEASVKTVKDRRDLIGKKIEFEYAGTGYIRLGTVQEVRGKNVLIDGDWLPVSRIYRARVVE